MKKILSAVLAVSMIFVGCKKDPILVGSITLNQSVASIVEGETLKLTATVTPNNAENQEIKWSSDNTGVATVDASGTVTAVKSGSAKITAAASDASGVKATCQVTVTDKITLVTKIELAYTEYALKKGETVTLTAAVSPADATNKAVNFVSSNPGVASVNAATGEVVAISAGTTNITAEAVDGSGVKSAACVVTVTEPKNIVFDIPYAVLKVTPASKGVTLKAFYGTYDAWADRDDATGTWASSNEAVVTVANGKLTPVAEGKAQVTITDADGNVGTCEVTVLPNTVKPTDIYPGVMIADCQLSVQATADEQLANGPWSAKKSTLTSGAGYVDGTKCIENKNCVNYRLFNYYNPSKPVDVSAVENPALYIRLWVEDITKVNWGVDGEIELSSDGSDAYNGSEEINWKLSDVFSNATGATGKGKQAIKNGWNNIVLPFESCTATIGTLRKNHINFFRIYQSTASLIQGGNLKLDQVRVINWKEFDACEDYQMWYDGGAASQKGIILDTEDKKQGTGSIGVKNYFWIGADSFRLKFWTGREYALPFDMDQTNSAVKFWLYTDKPEFLNAQQLNFELSSANTITDVIDFTIAPGSLNLKAGWNEVTFDLAGARVAGAGDLRKVTWLRLVLQFNNGVSPTLLDLKLDDIQIVKK